MLDIDFVLLYVDAPPRAPRSIPTGLRVFFPTGP
jgi:hypothetical protein